ncbi:MAG: DHH family phosphoesterase, partial [Erysipelotrichaceae bacterium]|nr:DHH family phosphoesterase [Erysipelotrichaceae bacterium]
MAIGALISALGFSVAFFGLWGAVRKQGFKVDVDVSRVLGKDAKDALAFGNIGMLTYDDEYIVTCTSAFFKDRGLNLEQKKVTSWASETRKVIEGEIDTIIAHDADSTYEIRRKADSNLLYVKDITAYENLTNRYEKNGVVVGLMQLDNYMEYQSYENEEIMAAINTKLRVPLISWAKQNGMLIRRLRSDRFFVVTNKEIFEKVREENFKILQVIKDEAKSMDVSISLSMAFAYGSNDFNQLDDMVNELIELAQSRGGDQVAYRSAGGYVQYVGGNSESGSTRSKVRVHTMAQTIQGAIYDSKQVFIAGHVDTDFDCMGAALGMSAWIKALKKPVYIVLKDVARDAQLESLMSKYASTIYDRHSFVSVEEAMDMMDREKDLMIMVDHGLPSISSAQPFLDECRKIIVIDHHRRSEEYVKHPILTYVESTASSTCELVSEMLHTIPHHVPIYEAEATIMYLGILVDTNRFKMHTDARTFEATALLRSWGANPNVAEKALCIDYSEFTLRNNLIQQAQPYGDGFMVACLDEAVDKAMLATVAQNLLLIKGCKASFVISRLKGKRHWSALSARSDGSYNVQKIVEKLKGGGHFSAAAVERNDISPQQLKQQLLKVLKEEPDESHLT